MRSPAEALAALRAQPCGAYVLDVLGAHPGTWVVGGAVRDALLGETPHELDVVVEGDPHPVALALGAVVAHHERFNTYLVDARGCQVDVVMARAERYAAPGALPDVRPATLHEDLARRDFTVNALALSPDGELHGAPRALEDLGDARLRVLHDASFRDDPTRLWRLVRYAVRLGFLPEPITDSLAAAAVRDGAPATVSGDRHGAELRLALIEPAPLAVLHAAQNLGIVSGLRLDPHLVADALTLLPATADARLATLGAVLPDAAWPEPFGFTAPERRVLTRCVELAPVPALGPGIRPSDIAARLRGEPAEAIAVAGARGDLETAALWLHHWRSVDLAIGGDDLLAAGIPEGPEVGARLARALARKLDGELTEGRDAELAAALEPEG